jgi:hypothetical protein
MREPSLQSEILINMLALFTVFMPGYVNYIFMEPNDKFPYY